MQLNKFMYRAAKTHPDAFIDIVYGNTAWGSNIAFCELGFEAREGWDPATGLGAINMPKFTQAAIDMAEEFFCSDTGDDGDANEGAGGGSNDADDDIDGDENAEEDDDSVEYGDGDGDDDENSGGAGN